MSNPWGSPQPFDPNQPVDPSFPSPADASGPPAYDYPAAPGPVYPGAAAPYPPPYPPQYPGGYPVGYPMRAPDQQQAVPAMVLGILGLVCCGLASPFAIWLGRKSMNQIDASGGMLGGRAQAQAGFVMGIIGTALWVLGALFYVLVVAFGVFAASKSQTY